ATVSGSTPDATAGNNSASVMTTALVQPDVNGDGVVSALDALCLLRDVAGMAGTSGCPEPSVHQRGDVNGDGVVGPLDALCLLRYVAGLPATPTCPLSQ